MIRLELNALKCVAVATSKEGVVKKNRIKVSCNLYRSNLIHIGLSYKYGHHCKTYGFFLHVWVSVYIYRSFVHILESFYVYRSFLHFEMYSSFLKV